MSDYMTSNCRQQQRCSLRWLRLTKLHPRWLMLLKKSWPVLTALLPPCCFAQGVDSLAISTNSVPPATAAEEILRQTSREGNLRLGPVDLFPHAGASLTYDDNVLISSRNQISDEVWSLSPGITAAIGDVSTAIPGQVTIDRLRNLLYYSLADESSKPRRFLGADYTPSVNLYTEHDQYNNVDHSVQLSGGYNFSRLTSELDFDFLHGQIKDNGVGDLVTLGTYAAALRNTYQLSERSTIEVNGDFWNYDYDDPRFQGYWDFRNTDWFNHQLGEKLSGGVGIALGYLEPTQDPSQTYEQALVRGVYRLSGKIYFNAYVGLECRQFKTDAPDSLNPVFTISGIYEPRETTALTLEAHRREAASPYSGYNYTQIGFRAGVRQGLFNRLFANLTGGYDQIQYNETTGTTSLNRADNLVYIQTSLDYEFNPHWTATLFYNYHQDASNVPIYDYSNNLVGARFVWRY